MQATSWRAGLRRLASLPPRLPGPREDALRLLDAGAIDLAEALERIGPKPASDDPFEVRWHAWLTSQAEEAAAEQAGDYRHLEVRR